METASTFSPVALLMPPDDSLGRAMRALISPPPPGVYEGVPADVYHSWDAASNSQLGHLAVSPAHLAAYRAGLVKETDALAFGRAFHMAILEPSAFVERYKVATRCCATTKKGAQCQNGGLHALRRGGFVCSTHYDAAVVDPDIEVLSEKDAVILAGMMATAQSDRKPRLRSLLYEQDGRNELSLVWVDRETGVTCKARLDRHLPFVAGGIILDPKSAVHADRERFKKAVYDRGYFRQGAMYLDGAAEVGLPVDGGFVLAAFEKSAPFEAARYRLLDEIVVEGRMSYRALLGLYAECQGRDEWPGYPDETQDLALTDWQLRNIEAQAEELEFSA